MDRNKYIVFYFDLREIFLSKYDDFEAKLRATKAESFRLIVEVLFEQYTEDKKPLEVIKGIIKV